MEHSLTLTSSTDDALDVIAFHGDPVEIDDDEYFITRRSKCDDVHDDHHLDEQDNDVVHSLAARLAPAFDEAHNLVVQFQQNVKSSMGDDLDSMHEGLAEDDDLKREISDLAHSEQLLREELEHANFFSHLFGASNDGELAEEEDFSGYDLSEEAESNLGPTTEADLAQEDFDVPESRLDIPLNNQNHSVVASPYRNGDSQSITPPPSSPMRLSKHDEPMELPRTPLKTAPNTPSSTTPATIDSTTTKTPLLIAGKTPVPYELADHRNSLDIVVQNGWYLVDMSRFALPKPLKPYASVLPTFSDFCISCPENRLKTWYIGFTETCKEDGKYMPSLLPVRTTLVNIRPDVLVGAVMDAVVSVCVGIRDTKPEMIRDHTILRRQGGHLRLVVTTTINNNNNNNNDNNSRENESKETEQMDFLVDAQLCTQKSQLCQRVLIVRIFHYDSTSSVSDPDSPHRLRNNNNNNNNTLEPSLMKTEDDRTPASFKHLQEACALVQRIEIDATKSAISSRRALKFKPAQCPSLTDRDSMSDAFSRHLRQTYKACPSVKDKTLTLPALNPDDWKLLKASWVWSEAMWEELDSRCLSYSSLASTRFGSFPCLPTLDVHYCSQIRKYSRETMITQLLNFATQLEEYAREAEYACANVVNMLEQTFEQYGVNPPPLPNPIPLTSYQLHYAAPQEICPPWGIKVMEALNEVQVWVDEAQKNNSNTTPYGITMEMTTPEAQEIFFGNIQPPQFSMVKQSTDLALKAVAAVLQAFQRQDDEEKNARLERKNHQVMDRLAFMKKHQEASVAVLESCTSDIAQRASNELKSKTRIHEVPILRWNVVAQNSTANCIVTANHIIFITQNIPFLGSIGGHKILQFHFKNDIDCFQTRESSTGILGALSPVAIRVMDAEGKELFAFRPATGGERLKNFLDVVLMIAHER